VQQALVLPKRHRDGDAAAAVHGLRRIEQQVDDRGLEQGVVRGHRQVGAVHRDGQRRGDRIAAHEGNRLREQRSQVEGSESGRPGTRKDLAKLVVDVRDPAAHVGRRHDRGVVERLFEIGKIDERVRSLAHRRS
jgi:hypothetical protein